MHPEPSSARLPGLALLAVVILGNGQNAALETRLAAELAAAGFAPVSAPESAVPASGRDLGDVARSRGAVAAVRIVPTGKGVEVWVADRVTGKTVSREIILPDDEGETEGLVATRTVELLRASLMEIRAPHPSRGEVEPAPEIEAIAYEPAPKKMPPRLLELELGPSVTAGAFDAPPMMHVSLGAEVRPLETLGFGLVALLPVIGSTVRSEEGRADLRVILAGARVRWSFEDASKVVVPCLGAGATVTMSGIEGRGGAGYAGRDEWVFAATPFVDVGAALRLTDILRLRLDALGGWTVPRTVVLLAGHRALDWGGPLLVGTLALEIFVL
jgi:hypothetical protein